MERVKSMLAQIDRGLLSDESRLTGTSASGEGNAGLTIPAILELGGTAGYVTTNQSTETRTLHDFVYNQLEEKLLDRRRIKRLPQDFTSARLLSEEVRSTISPIEYVLVRGSCFFSDHTYMTMLMENINDVMRASVELSYHNRVQGISGKEKSSLVQQRNQEVASKKVDPGMVKNLLQMFSLFLKDRLIFKVVPFPEEPNIRIVRPLQPELLRERMEDIRFKFGTAPRGEWTVFGQIASVPQVDDDAMVFNYQFSNPMDKALEGMFSAMRPIERFFGVSYPEIAITPIAVYRD